MTEANWAGERFRELIQLLPDNISINMLMAGPYMGQDKHNKVFYLTILVYPSIPSSIYVLHLSIYLCIIQF